jgi:hypothetical protein
MLMLTIQLGTHRINKAQITEQHANSLFYAIKIEALGATVG